MLSNAMRVCVSNFQNTNVTKPYGSTLLALQGGGGVKCPEKVLRRCTLLAGVELISLLFCRTSGSETH